MLKFGLDRFASAVKTIAAVHGVFHPTCSKDVIDFECVGATVKFMNDWDFEPYDLAFICSLMLA